MRKFGISILCAAVAVLAVLFSYFMMRNTDDDTLSAETVYDLAKESGYEGTFQEFIDEFRGVSGKDGAGIASAKVNSKGRLIITYTDGHTVDAGAVNVGSQTVTGEISGLALNYALTSSVSIHSKLSENHYSSGAGVIYKLNKTAGDAYIITNYHVLYNRTSAQRIPDTDISVYLYGMEYPEYAIPVQYVGGSSSYDIAILKISGSEVLKNSSASAIRRGNSELVEVLDTVVAIGNPTGSGISATRGSVSIESENRYVNITASGGSIFMRIIRFDAAVNKGNSGGGLYNADGELVGIVTAKDTSEGTEGVAYAVPVNVAASVADNILHYCDGKAFENGKILKMGLELGVKSVKVLYEETRDCTVKYETVVINSVEAGSYAENLGLAVGDVLKRVSVDGTAREITGVYQAPEMMLDARIGSTIVYTVIRGTSEMNFTLTVPSNLTQIK